MFFEISKNSQENTCVRVSFLIKLQTLCLRPATLLKKRLWHRCFPVKFAKFLRTAFLQNTSGRILLRFQDLKLSNLADLYCVKSVQIISFVWSVFSCIWTEYGDLSSKSSYSVQIQESKEQKKLRTWTLFTQCWSNFVI